MNNEQLEISNEEIKMKNYNTIFYTRKKSICNSFLFALCSLLFAICYSLFAICSCTSTAISAEEYFSIGMAYYDLGKFEDAEKWLNRAKQANKTFVASQYNLGRIAFERNRLEEAAVQFEGILKRDPDNILALRAAAYTRIKMGDMEKAQVHYSRLLRLIPESADDGYNHALVLFAMKRYQEAENILEKYPFALRENKDMQLLFARSQGRQNKVEAIDTFAEWLKDNNDNVARFEYAQVLEHHEFFARAIEEYRKTLEDIGTSTVPEKTEIRFSIARVLLIAEGNTTDGITELQGAITDGFKDIAAIEELIDSGKITGGNLASLRTIVDDLKREEIAEQERIAQAAREKEEEEQEEDSDLESETDPETGAD